MKKKIFTLVLIILTCVGTLTADIVRVVAGGIYYNLDRENMTAEVTYQSIRNVANIDYLYNEYNQIQIANIPNVIIYNDSSYNVTSIGEGAFSGCIYLKSVILPSSLNKIGVKAFRNSYKLTTIEIPDNVTTIEDQAFGGDFKLESVTVGLNVTSCAGSAFNECTGLRTVIWNAIDCKSASLQGTFLDSVVLGNQVRTIPSGFCAGRTSLNKINIPNSVTNIGSSAFSGTGLTSINIPNSVISIGSYAFSNCQSLTSMTIPSSVKKIGEGTFSNSRNLTSLSMGNNVDSIGYHAFSDCSGLISLEIPNSVKFIGGRAFYGCTSLTSLTIGENVDSIGDNFLASCSNLKSVVWNAKDCADFNIYNGPQPPFNDGNNTQSKFVITFGENVMHIPALLTYGPTAYYRLDTVICLGSIPASLGQDALDDALDNNNCYIYVPCGTKNAYKQAWPKYASRITSSNSCPPEEEITYYTVTFKDWDGTILKTEQVEEGQSATPPANPTREGYTFDGWDKDYTNVQSNLIITALYKQNTPSTTYYTVTFKDWNGTVLKTEQVEKGQSATAPANPTREGYTFTGWDKDFSNVQSDLIVTAQYKQNTPTITYYTVTFKDWDGTVLKTQQVEKGKSATAPANPTREGYTFTGWDKDFSNVQSDLIVTAMYTQNTVYYTVTFKDWNGTVLKTQQVEKGKSAAAPANPTRDGYTFIGWDTSFANVQSDLIVTAIYQKNQTPVTNAIKVHLDPSSTYGTYGWDEVYLWAWTDGGNIFSEWPGQRIDIDADGWYSYTFTQDISNVNIIWNNGLGAQTIDITGITESTCFALDDVWGTQISVRIIDCPTSVVYYNVFFKDWDGTVLKTQQVEKGKSATAPANPTREGYTFTGWDKDFSNVQSDLIVTALYTQNTVYYTVTFKDWNGTVLKTQQVEKGKSAAAPANPTRDGYTFTGWDKDFSNVQSDLIVTAQYRKNETPAEAITVRLQALSATSWSKVNLYYWADGVDGPAWPGITLSKDAQGWYGYTFDSSVKLVNIIWSNGSGDQTVDITDVTESTCYMLNSTTGRGITVSLLECEAEAIEDIHVDGDKPVKVLHEGQIYILRGAKIYTLQGQEVK